jgi:hypothetical protein
MILAVGIAILVAMPFLIMSGINSRPPQGDGTPAEQYVRDALVERTSGTQRQRKERQNIEGRIAQAARVGDMDKATALAQQGIDAGTITLDDANYAIERAVGPPLEAGFKRLPLDIQMGALQKATPQERERLAPLLIQKFERDIPKEPEQEQKRLLEKLNVLHITPAELQAAQQ